MIKIGTKNYDNLINNQKYNKDDLSDVDLSIYALYSCACPYSNILHPSLDLKNKGRNINVAVIGLNALYDAMILSKYYVNIDLIDIGLKLISDQYVPDWDCTCYSIDMND